MIAELHPKLVIKMRRGSISSFDEDGFLGELVPLGWLALLDSICDIVLGVEARYRAKASSTEYSTGEV